jgi:hypothetical protein
MGGRIVLPNGLVVSAGENFSIENQKSPDRYLPHPGRAASIAQR